MHFIFGMCLRACEINRSEIKRKLSDNNKFCALPVDILYVCVTLNSGVNVVHGNF